MASGCGDRGDRVLCYNRFLRSLSTKNWAVARREHGAVETIYHVQTGTHGVLLVRARNRAGERTADAPSAAAGC
jgi:hypothetical protein